MKAFINSDISNPTDVMMAEYLLTDTHYNFLDCQNLESQDRDKVLEKWKTQTDWSTIIQSHSYDNYYIYLRHNTEEAKAYITFNHASVQINVRSADEELSLKLASGLKTFLDSPLVPTDDTIPVAFWFQGKGGPSVRTRDLTVDPWDISKENYSESIQKQVENLVKLERPSNKAKLVILNGLAGCGKTNLIRHLLWEWREWAEGAFITDPEMFMGSAGYMLEVCLRESYDDDDKVKWKILVLEDVDKYMAVSSKTTNGDQVSKLLNLLDGMIGQGLNVLCIMTANEEHNKLHSAFTRPGRCLADLEFTGLNTEEAKIWMEAKGMPTDLLPGGSKAQVGFVNKGNLIYYTLADLYNIYWKWKNGEV